MLTNYTYNEFLQFVKDEVYNKFTFEQYLIDKFGKNYIDFFRKKNEKFDEYSFVNEINFRHYGLEISNITNNELFWQYYNTLQHDVTTYRLHELGKMISFLVFLQVRHKTEKWQFVFCQNNGLPYDPQILDTVANYTNAFLLYSMPEYRISLKEAQGYEISLLVFVEPHKSEFGFFRNPYPMFNAGVMNVFIQKYANYRLNKPNNKPDWLESMAKDLELKLDVNGRFYLQETGKALESK